MRRITFPAVAGFAVTLLFALPATVIHSRAQAPQQDLTPLLAKPTSEMRLVVTRYNADRNTLIGHFAGQSGRGGGGGRAGGGGAAGGPAAAPPPTPVPISAARLARLKRYDLDWQAALAKVDPAKLSALAKPEIVALNTTVASNLQQIEADGLTLAQVAPLVPFAPKLVGLIEARIRVDQVEPQKAAGTLMSVIGELKTLRANLDATTTDFTKVRAVALPAAQAATQLRSGITEWFNFYNGYDPLFTWWMGMPFKQLDAGLQEYITFLRDKVAKTDADGPVTPATIPPVTPSPASKYASVPDLAEILALGQDEMRDIVGRFNSGRPGGGGRGGRGGQPAAADPASPAAAASPNAYYNEWLTALKSLDFDRLSRNAQVDYLYIRWTAESEIKRAGETIPPGPPRKADTSDIKGQPRGRTGLIRDLSDNMIPYTPEQLIALANKEFAWCEEEMKKASRALGFGDDWKKALEHTKQTAVAPGAQPRMIMDLIDEAVAYLRANDLITVPAVAAETVHMTMMSPQAQLTSPFFLGGVGGIIVSYPTDTMEYDARLQSMRGNNPGFSHATAFHETIPGHLLVGYLGQRYGDYRPDLRGGGPFYGEGWPLYWELTLYDMGFDKTPEQKIGALFWRMHRCARIIFSLNFHMGLWSPQESVNFLVDKVGHERDNATAEVRRSFESAQYANQPLYQAAYLLGGLQFRGLRRQLVDTKIMTNKQFHDEILRQGNMPIALIRLAVTRDKLTRDMDINWKFYGELPEK
jgi:hypothetical protein